MRIAFLNPQGNFDSKDSYWTEHPDFGGQLVYVKELANALKAKGHEVDIFTRLIKDSNWPEFGKEVETYPDTGLRVIRIPFGGDMFLRKELLWPYLPEYVKGILHYYQKENNWPDFVTAHYGDGGISAVMMKEATGIPFSFTAHSLGAQKMDKMNISTCTFEDINHQYAFAKRIHAERITMENASIRFVSTSQEKTNQYQHGMYRDIFENQTREFMVAPPGVNQNLFYFEDQDFEKLNKVKRRDFHENRRSLPITIASSRLDPKKNVLGLVNAYANNFELQKKSNLLLAVRGTENPYHTIKGLKEEEQAEIMKILKIIELHGLKGKVAFIQLSSQKELAACYRALASQGGIFSLTSLYEPFGLATIEAMACGLPVVVTKNGGGKEILEEGNEKFGVLVDPENSEMIAETLLFLLKQPKEWKKFHQKGLRRVREHYTWHSTAETYQDSMANIIAKNKKTTHLYDGNQDFSSYQSWLSNPTQNMIHFIQYKRLNAKEGKG